MAYFSSDFETPLYFQIFLTFIFQKKKLSKISKKFNCELFEFPPPALSKMCLKHAKHTVEKKPQRAKKLSSKNLKNPPRSGLSTVARGPKPGKNPKNPGFWALFRAKNSGFLGCFWPLKMEFRKKYGEKWREKLGNGSPWCSQSFLWVWGHNSQMPLRNSDFPGSK